MKEKQILAEHGKTVLENFSDRNTPLPGNICHDYGGEVIKKVTGLFRRQLTYSIPECSNCRRIYFSAINVRSTGEKEFKKLLNTPYGL